jgi:hypothetical protein
MGKLESHKLRDFLTSKVASVRADLTTRIKSIAEEEVNNRVNELAGHKITSEITDKSFIIGVNPNADDPSGSKLAQAEFHDLAFKSAFNILKNKEEVISRLNRE